MANKVVGLGSRKRPISNVLPSDSKSLQVKVFVRVRPFNEREEGCGCKKVVSIMDENSLMFDPEQEEELFYFKGVPQKARDMTRRANKNLHFQFDRVFQLESSNMEVFEASTKNIISSIFEGINCSVFAYGATGAGKTFTMLGTEGQPGIAYLTMVELLNQIDSSKEMKVTLGASYLEVYNENVKDLLQPSSSVLQLREDGIGGRITVAGLKTYTINHADELFTLLNEGNRNRSQHPTDSNAESSRSHAVFQVYARVVSKGTVTFSKLSMIDLAGSERGSATGGKGLRFKEGSNINKSLLALGNCINALADGLKHVPYRDSKLTRILKDSLGGNCQTVMIANISPSSSSFEDTYNTLKYATRTKCIKSTITRNIMNESLSIPQYKKMLQELTQKVDSLQGGVLPDISKWKTRIEKTFEERRNLVKEVWSLQSQLRLTEYRIQLKMKISSQHNQDNKLPCFNRLEASINQLKARSESIGGRLAEFAPRLLENKTQIEQLEKDIEAEPKFLPLLSPILENCKSNVKQDEAEIQVNHSIKVVSLFSKDLKNMNSAIEKMIPVLHEYHNILRAQSYVSQDLNDKYELAIKSLDGTKGVSWLGDDEDVDEQIDLGSLLKIGESEMAKQLTTTIFIPTYSLRQNFRLGNIVSTSPLRKHTKHLSKTKVDDKSKRVMLNPRTASPDKENTIKRTISTSAISKKMMLNSRTATPVKEKIIKRAISSPALKAKTNVKVRSNLRPHPYQRTPLSNITVKKSNVITTATKTNKK